MDCLKPVVAAALVILVTVGCGRGQPSPAGVAWHRFPVDPATRVEPALAVLYSSDDLTPTATLARLGYPDRMLFQLHRDHPRLRVVLMSCPANRYSGGLKLTDSPAGLETWNTLAVGTGFDWIELGGSGYTHSPPEDSNLDHHEFSIRQSGCNIDHRLLGEPDYCRRQLGLARAAYRAAGIPDDRVLVMRFPGAEHSPAALEAAAQSGFLTVFESGRKDEPGREWWTALPGGAEILQIPHTGTLKSFASAPSLEKRLVDGSIPAAMVATDPEFVAAVGRGTSLADRVESTGGILHLTDRWSETFREFGGVVPRYLIVDAVLDEIESRYGPRAWYPSARDLVLWLYARRYSRLSRTVERSAILVEVEPSREWPWLPASGLENASVKVDLPDDGSARIRDVMIQEGQGKWRPLDRSRWWPSDEGVVALFPLRGPVRLKLTVNRP